MWSPPDPGMGEGEDESVDDAGRWGKVWRGGKVQVDCGGRPFGEKRARPFGKRACPFGERGVLVACLVGGLEISSFSFIQLRVDDN
jgi:hypothetical protein